MTELVDLEGIRIPDPVLLVQVHPRALGRRIVDVVRDRDPVIDTERGEKARPLHRRNPVTIPFAGLPVQDGALPGGLRRSREHIGRDRRLGGGDRSGEEEQEGDTPRRGKFRQMQGGKGARRTSGCWDSA